MAWVYSERFRAPRGLAVVERSFYRLVGTAPSRSRAGRPTRRPRSSYGRLRRAALPAAEVARPTALNPDGIAAVSPSVAANTVASFITNTNWQYYAGETTMSYLSQMAGLGGAELRLRRHRHGRPCRCHPRLCPPLARRARQLLGRLIAARLHPVAAGTDRRCLPDLARGRPDVLGSCDRSHTLGADADDRSRPRRLARGDQAAGHERRRLLQREFGASRSRIRTGSRTSSSCSRSS